MLQSQDFLSLLHSYHKLFSHSELSLYPLWMMALLLLFQQCFQGWMKIYSVCQNLKSIVYLSLELCKLPLLRFKILYFAEPAIVGCFLFFGFFWSINIRFSRWSIMIPNHIVISFLQFDIHRQLEETKILFFTLSYAVFGV